MSEQWLGLESIPTPDYDDISRRERDDEFTVEHVYAYSIFIKQVTPELSLEIKFFDTTEHDDWEIAHMMTFITDGNKRICHSEIGPSYLRYHNGQVVGKGWKHKDRYHRVDGPAKISMYSPTEREEYWWFNGEYGRLEDGLCKQAYEDNILTFASYRGQNEIGTVQEINENYNEDGSVRARLIIELKPPWQLHTWFNTNGTIARKVAYHDYRKTSINRWNRRNVQ